MVTSEELFGNGTTCYRAKRAYSGDWEYAVKIKWRWARDRPENELLELASAKQVWGAMSLAHYSEHQSTADLRAGHRWLSPYKRFVDDVQDPDAFGLQHFTEDTDYHLKNRILTCLVTSPLGRPLSTFRSPVELQQVLHDAIECHRSLYQTAGILHRDVSPGNVIIVDSKAEQPKGILIDLDSAVRVDNGENSDGSIVGTRLFMAIGILQGSRHKYRHDLESFLYLFLWTVIANHADSLPTESKLRRWNTGSWKDLAARKTLDMEENFEAILDEFGLEFETLKPTARMLHRALFGADESSQTNTENSKEVEDRLYDEMLNAFIEN